MWLDEIALVIGQMVIGGVFLVIIVLLAMKIWSKIPEKAQDRIINFLEYAWVIYLVLAGIGTILAVLYGIFSGLFL